MALQRKAYLPARTAVFLTKRGIPYISSLESILDVIFGWQGMRFVYKTKCRKLDSTLPHRIVRLSYKTLKITKK